MEFQKKKAEEELLSALSRIGLEVSPELKSPGGARSPMGPLETAPASLAEIHGPAPGYLPPAPAEAVPALPRDLQDEK